MRLRLLACLAAVSSVLTPVAHADEPREPLPVSHSFLAGIAAELTSPGSAPPGSNDFSCRPAARHPRPVILLHGFLGNMTDNMHTVSPVLRNDGYCVFAMTYGRYPKLDPTGRLGGLDYIQNSARQLARFVDRVRAATGSSTVDIVGHSLGGLMPRYYLKHHDGAAAKVTNLVAVGAPNQGINVSDLAFSLGRVIPGGSDLLRLIGRFGTPVVPVLGQFLDPSMLAGLNAGGGTRPGVHYTNIATNFDQLVPPELAFLPAGPNVTNIVVQSGCPLDLAGHLAIIADPVAMRHVRNVLDPGHATPAPCVPVLPVAGTA